MNFIGNLLFIYAKCIIAQETQFYSWTFDSQSDWIVIDAGEGVEWDSTYTGIGTGGYVELDGGPSIVDSPLLPTTGYEAIKIEIDIDRSDHLTSTEFCQLGYKSASTDWIYENVAGGSTGNLRSKSFNIPNNNDYNDQSSFQLRLRNTANDPDHICWYDNLKMYGVAQTFATTTPPSTAPTDDPIADPTNNPTTSNPSTVPSMIPTANPTNDPTVDPTSEPTNDPTYDPTEDPITAGPTFVPTSNPTCDPTRYPTFDPTSVPIRNPTTFLPSDAPSQTPTTMTSRIIDGQAIEHDKQNFTIIVTVTEEIDPAEIDNVIIDSLSITNEDILDRDVTVDGVTYKISADDELDEADVDEIVTEGLQTAFPEADIEVDVTEGVIDPTEAEEISDSVTMFDLSELIGIEWLFILTGLVMALLCCIVVLLFCLCCKKRRDHQRKFEKDASMMDSHDTTIDRDGEFEPGTGFGITQTQMVNLNMSPSSVKPISASSFINVNLMQPVHNFQYEVRDSIGPTRALPPDTPALGPENGRAETPSDEDFFTTPKDNQYNDILTNNGDITMGMEYNSGGYHDKKKDSTEEHSVDVINGGNRESRRGSIALPQMTYTNSDTLYITSGNTVQ